MHRLSMTKLQDGVELDLLVLSEANGQKCKKNFVDWTESRPQEFGLSHVHHKDVSDDTSVFSMVAQKGYGPSKKPRIRYAALEACLEQLREVAENENASIHMPRIGCGEAGGSWSVIESFLYEQLVLHGIKVTIYDLKKYRGEETQAQKRLAFNS